MHVKMVWPWFSKSFDTSIVTQQVLGGQTDKVVIFIDGKGNKYTSLPNPFTNSIKDKETITVRVSHRIIYAVTLKLLLI
jgi:hypothetical protein